MTDEVNIFREVFQLINKENLIIPDDLMKLGSNHHSLLTEKTEGTREHAKHHGNTLRKVQTALEWSSFFKEQTA